MSKRVKKSEVYGSSIKYDDKTQSYKRNGKFVNFGIGDNRVYDVGDVFLKGNVIFGIITETPRVITLGGPSSTGDGDFDKNIGLIWALSRVDHVFSKNCTPENIAGVFKACSGVGGCASACLRGIKYVNKFGASCWIHLNGKGMKDVCRIMGHEASELHVRAADLLNETYRGHRANGDSVIPVWSIRANDMPAFKMMYREKIVTSQKVGSKEFLITKEVFEAEELFKVSVKHLMKNFPTEPKFEIANDPDCDEQLVEEQLIACNTAMNNGVSYICGMPGVGKTSSLCKIIENSNGTVILTPSHVAREVVHQRAKKNLIPESTFSVEVLAFAIRHIHTWHPDAIASSLDFNPSERSVQMMKKFQDPEGGIQVETLIIEETSMADIFQTSAVLGEFCNFPSFKRVVFCGDPNQLESISKGCVLKDVMESPGVPGTVLKINHRSSSGLSNNLERIITSSLAFIEEDDTFEIREYGLEECHVETDRYGRRRVVVRDPIIRLFLEHVESGIPCHVFAHTNIEVKQLNSGIKLALFGEDSVLYPIGCKVRVKDCEVITPPVFHHNDFLEIAEVRGAKEFLVKRWSDPGEFPKLTLIKVEGRIRDALDLGFASTIFSFQGSECENVICHTVPNSAYFHRNALFTGVSRARNKAYIVGVKDSTCSWKKVLYKKPVPRISNLSRVL